MILTQTLLIILVTVGTIGKELSEKRRKEINDGIAVLLTKLDSVNPGIVTTQECAPYANALITLKWLDYLSPDAHYFDYNKKISKDYSFEKLRENMNLVLQSLESSNDRTVNNYADLVVCFDDMIEELSKNKGWDGDRAIIKATQEMILQVYIEKTGLEVQPGQTIKVKADLIVNVKNPSTAKKEKLERQFIVPPLHTLTIIKEACKD